MDVTKNSLLHTFKTLKDHCSILDSSVIKEYFPDGDFEIALNKFFDVDISDVESFYMLDYPFRGETVFEERKFVELVDVIPEFIVSLIKVGMPFIVSLHKYQNSRKSEPVLLSLSNLVESSKIVYHSWNLLDDLLNQEGREQQSSIIELQSKLGQLVRVKPHYDLLGALQNVYNSIVLMAISEGIIDKGFFKLFIHSDSDKREALYSLAGRELSALRTLNSITGEDSIDDIIPRIRQDLLQNGFPQLNQPRSSQISEAYIINPNKKVAQIEELSIQYGQVDGLVLHLPEDQTTKRSPVSLSLTSGDEKVGSIRLSHMQAAFVHYLGMERTSKSSYWLYKPEEHRDKLRDIRKCYCLPNYFETEIEFESPIPKSAKTWIWDFNNSTRKDLRSKIHGNIRNMLAEDLYFDLIVSIPEIDPGRKANYKLNSQVEYFKVQKHS